MDKSAITICGMVCLTILEGIALSVGLDGQLFSGIVALIALLSGVPIGLILKEKINDVRGLQSNEE